MDTQKLIPVIAPDEAEIEALAIVAAFMHRAKMQLVERLQSGDLDYRHALMLAELRDQVTDAALLCEGMEALTG